MSDDQHDTDEGSVWIRTEPSPDGTTYVVTLAATNDNSTVLTPERAMRHAAAVHAIAHRALYDSAVARQVHENLGLDMPTAAHVVQMMRADRPAIDPADTAPLCLEPGVSVHRALAPFITVSLGDQRLGQWTIPDAIEHAHAVLEAVAVADLDAGYYRALTGQLGADSGTARNVVDDVGNWRIQNGDQATDPKK